MSDIPSGMMVRPMPWMVRAPTMKAKLGEKPVTETDAA